MIKVSIILPVYNVERYLRQALDSVLNQTLQEIEIICINDGSTDNSLTILEYYAKKDSRVKIYNQNNQGPGIARNLGISKASGEYIMFLDPDDWYTLDACETAYNQIEKNKNDFVMFNFFKYFEENETLEIADWRLKPFKKNFEDENLKLCNFKNYIKCSFTWSQIYSKKFITENNIKYSQGKLGEDVPFYIKALIYANTISIIQKPLYYYRIHKNSVSFAYNKQWRDLIAVRYQCVDMLNERQIEKMQLQTILSYLIRSLLYWYDLIEKDKTQVRKDFYNELRKFYTLLDKNYDINLIRDYINWQKFQNICKYSWNQKILLEFLQNIFSISLVEKSATKKHVVVTILGIKIKLKSKYLTVSATTNFWGTHKIYNFFGLKFTKATELYVRNRNLFNKYKKNNIDISLYPTATGQMRNLQLANLYLLKCLDEICKQNNINYWLDFGSLLGAVRHNGFIPWDDDIDVAMMRQDYERIVDIVNNNTVDPDIYADYLLYPDNPFGIKQRMGAYFIIKIRHKKSDKLFVDIFPYDYSGYIMNEEEQLELTKIARNCNSVIRSKYDESFSAEDIIKDKKKWRKFLYGSPEVPNNESDLIWGFDYEHRWKKWAFSHDTIFPLQNINFEGLTFRCANKKEQYLSEVYGDYMAYPKNIKHSHNLYHKIPDEDIKIISEIAQKLKDRYK
ncbi:MAG: LicD family protein [Muribaculaceae bacterium]|nr:LicD family protein [Muribaculaceae bacterium]